MTSDSYHGGMNSGYFNELKDKSQHYQPKAAVKQNDGADSDSVVVVLSVYDI